MSCRELIEKAVDMFYAGVDVDEIRPVLRKAKEIHEKSGGTAKDWPGLTDDRGMWDYFPYGSL